MQTSDLAYLAGLLDGEGYIGIKYRKARAVGHAPAHMPNVKIKMVDEDIIRWLHATFGGCFYMEKRYNMDEHHRNAYVWSVGGEQAADVIRSVLPFLRVKRRQAELFLQYFSVRDMHRGRSPSKEEIELRDSYRFAIQALNYGRVRRAV